MAEQGYWKLFAHVIGGVFCERKHQLLRPFYGLGFNQQTGLIKTSVFDGLITNKSKGILHIEQAIIIRLYQ